MDFRTDLAVEKSEAAYKYLTENAALNKSRINPILADLRDCTDMFEDRSIDLLISNPPYIRSSELPTLQREVRYEPAMALDGGKSGYDFYELIVSLWTAKLKPGGSVAFEIGEGQFDHIAGLLRAAGYSDIKGFADIQGITRAVTAVL